MALTLLVGGARSGKSALAVRLGECSLRPVVFVATAEPSDAEMTERIQRHRAERPDDWALVEEPADLHRAFAEVGADDFVVVDCLTLWVSNLLQRGSKPDTIEREAAVVAGLAACRPGPTVAVTNEVGLGVVPATPLGRAYRDVLGRVNAIWAAEARDAVFVVAGRLLRLERAEAIFSGLRD